MVCLSVVIFDFKSLLVLIIVLNVFIFKVFLVWFFLFVVIYVIVLLVLIRCGRWIVLLKLGIMFNFILGRFILVLELVIW